MIVITRLYTLLKQKTSPCCSTIFSTKHDEDHIGINKQICKLAIVRKAIRAIFSNEKLHAIYIDHILTENDFFNIIPKYRGYGVPSSIHLNCIHFITVGDRFDTYLFDNLLMNK